MDFSLHKNPSLVENPSIVDDLALTKKSTIEGFGFQCIKQAMDGGFLTDLSQRQLNTCLIMLPGN